MRKYIWSQYPKERERERAKRNKIKINNKTYENGKLDDANFHSNAEAYECVRYCFTFKI